MRDGTTEIARSSSAERGRWRRFGADGFVVVERIIDPALAAPALGTLRGPVRRHVRDRPVPRRVELAGGREPPELTRQICNAWKSDRAIARVVLRADIGRACARLGGWPGARLSQDNVLWKPPGGKAARIPPGLELRAVGDPAEWVSCWIALEDTTAAQGTVEYVRGIAPVAGNGG